MKKFLPVLLFFLLALALLPAVPAKAGTTINSVTIYTWYQDANNPYEEYQVSKAKVGDWVKVVLRISQFTSVTLTVKDPVGNVLPVKPTTACTTSPCTWWFNTTNQAGLYQLDFYVNQTTHYYYNFLVENWRILDYSISLPTVKMVLPDGTIVDVIKLPSSDLNGSLSIDVDSSLTQPFNVTVAIGSTTLGKVVVYPHGKSPCSISLPFIVNGKGYITLGKASYTISVLPWKVSTNVVQSSTYYAVPEGGFPFADFTVYGTLPSSVTIGSAISITGASVTVAPKSGYTRLGTGFYAPVALSFDGVFMLSTTPNGTPILYNLSSSSSLSLSKFKGNLPSIGTHTMSFGVVPLNYLASPSFLTGAASVAKEDASVTVLPGGVFSLAIKDAELSVGKTATVVVNWDRSSTGSWLVSGDTIRTPIDVKILIGSDLYNEAFSSIAGKNGTKTNITVSVPAVKYTYNSVIGTATASLYVAGTSVATNSTGIPYKFAGYHVILYRGGSIWTPPASGIMVDVYSSGTKVASVNATKADFYVFTYPSAKFSVSQQLDPVSKLVGSADAASSLGNIADVQLNLNLQVVLPKDKAYIPKSYTGAIGVALLAPLDVGTYKLWNGLNAVTDPIANSTDVFISWDSSAKDYATITVNTKGTYVISYKADNKGAAFPDNTVIAYIYDTTGKNITVLKSSLVDNPGYYTTIDYIGNNTIKVYVKTVAPFPIVSGKSIILTVSPSSLKLVGYKNAEKTSPYNDYQFYLNDGGYVLYQLPTGGTEQQVVVNATAMVPVDLSPTVPEYDFTHSVLMTFKTVAPSAPTGVIAGVSTDMIILVLTVIILAVAIYYLIKK